VGVGAAAGAGEREREREREKVGVGEAVVAPPLNYTGLPPHSIAGSKAGDAHAHTHAHTHAHAAVAPGGRRLRADERARAEASYIALNTVGSGDGGGPAGGVAPAGYFRSGITGRPWLAVQDVQISLGLGGGAEQADQTSRHSAGLSAAASGLDRLGMAASGGGAAGPPRAVPTVTVPYVAAAKPAFK
jgi:hypothetical protein